MRLEHHLKNRYLKAGRYILGYIFSEQEWGRKISLHFYQHLVKLSSEHLRLDAKLVDHRLQKSGLVEISANHYVRLTNKGYSILYKERVDPYLALMRIQDNIPDHSFTRDGRKNGTFSNKRTTKRMKKYRQDLDDYSDY